MIENIKQKQLYDVDIVYKIHESQLLRHAEVPTTG